MSFETDSELSRRIALYAAILTDGSVDFKEKYFRKVKKAYGLRSRAVHGSGLKQAQLEDALRDAASILINIIAKCVEIGRVPSPSELDRLAIAPTVR